MCWNFTPFYDWIIFHCMQRHFVYSFNLWWTFCFFHLWLLWIILLWTLLYKYLFKSLHLVLQGLCPGAELLAHVGVLCLICWENNRHQVPLCVGHWKDPVDPEINVTWTPPLPASFHSESFAAQVLLRPFGCWPRLESIILHSSAL